MDVFDLFAKIVLDTSEYEKGLNGASQKMVAVGNILNQEVSKPLLNIGKNMLQTGMDYESGMSKVQAISGATASEMKALGDEAMRMASQTKFSTAESAEAYQYMAMAGWKSGQMVDGLSGIMNLAAASGEDLATTSDIVTDALTAFGMQAADSGHFADILAAASSNANTNVSMMGETFKYVAPVAGSLGYSAEDTALAIGLMANSGIKASQAGTSLRSIMTRLSTDAGASSKALGALGVLTEKLGVEFYNTDGSARDLMSVIDDSRVAWRGLSDEQAIAYAKTIAGQEGMSSWLALMNAADTDVEKLSSAIANSNGMSQNMAETMQDNAAGAVEKLKSAINVLFTQLSEHLLPTFTDIVKKVTDVVNRFGELDGGTQKLIMAIAGIAAAAGPVLIVLGKVIKSVSTIGGALGKLVGVVKTVGGAISGLFSILAANPIVLIIAAVSALIAIIVSLWNNCEEFRNFWIGAWENIKEVASSVWEAITEFFTNAWENIKLAWSNVVEFFSGIWEGIKGVFSTVVETLGGFFSAAWEGIVSVWNTVVGFFAGIWNGIVSVFSVVASTLTGFFSAAWNGIVSVWNAVVGFFSGIWEGIKSIFSAVSSTLTGFFSGAWNGIKNAWSSVTSFFSDVWSSIKNTFSNAVSEFANIGKNIVTGLWEGIKSMASWIADKVSGFVGGIVDGVKGVLGIHSPSKVFAGIGNNMALGLGEGWNDEFNSIRRDIEGTMDFSSADINFPRTDFSVNGSYTRGSAGNNATAAQSQEKQPAVIIVQLESGLEIARQMVADINQLRRIEGI